MNNQKNIRAALIDMDGTLYDSMPNHVRAWKRLLDEHNIEASEEELFLFEGSTGAQIIDTLMLRSLGRHASDQEKVDLYALKAKYFTEMPPVTLMPGAREMVDELRRRNIITVLVTGSGQNSLLSRLDTDFPEAFPADMRVTSASVAHGKPAPDPYLRGLELAGVSADEAIAIDNAPLGTRSGYTAGVFTIGVVTGPIPQDELSQNGADIVYGSMPDFARHLPELLDKLSK